nr:hypothetical protein [Tanacetum cinerariifolium]
MARLVTSKGIAVELKKNNANAGGIIHEATTSYTSQQNGMAERKNKALKEMVNSMLSYSGLSCRAVVWLPDLKRKLWVKRVLTASLLDMLSIPRHIGFMLLNDPVSINSIKESRDAIFDENCFFSIPRPKDIIPNSVESQRDDHSDVPSETPKPRKGKRVRKAKSYGSDFQLYLVKRSRDQVGSQYSYCYSIEEDPRTYDEAMQSWDDAFWKEAIDDEIGLIMENNTWVLSDLPPGCKPLGCKWIFKRKMKVNETIDKFKARLVIQGFRQKKGSITLIPIFGKGVIICLYVDDMWIFGTGQNQVDNTKKFLSLRFSIKDMGEVDVILGIKIKHENKEIVITQFHYIEKLLKKFNCENCTSVSTLMDPVEKLKQNTGKPVDQLEYSRAICCLMYAMASTRHDIAYAVGRLSRCTINPSRQHCQAITRAMPEEEDAFLVEGNLCVDYTDAGIVRRCYRGSNKDKGKDSLETKYMAEDASSKKFLVCNFNNNKMVNSRPVMEQFNELLRILGQYTQHGLKMEESIFISSVIDKLPPPWKDFKHTLKHGKDDLSLV